MCVILFIISGSFWSASRLGRTTCRVNTFLMFIKCNGNNLRKLIQQRWPMLWLLLYLWKKLEKWRFSHKVLLLLLQKREQNSGFQEKLQVLPKKIEKMIITLTPPPIFFIPQFWRSIRRTRWQGCSWSSTRPSTSSSTAPEARNFRST
jgi:hypothetical protein